MFIIHNDTMNIESGNVSVIRVAAKADETAPHHPWAVNWHRSFAGLLSLQGRLAAIDAQEVKSIFGALVDGVSNAVDGKETS